MLMIIPIHVNQFGKPSIEMGFKLPTRCVPRSNPQKWSNMGILYMFFPTLGISMPTRPRGQGRIYIVYPIGSVMVCHILPYMDPHLPSTKTPVLDPHQSTINIRIRHGYLNLFNRNIPNLPWGHFLITLLVELKSSRRSWLPGSVPEQQTNTCHHLSTLKKVAGTYNNVVKTIINHPFGNGLLLFWLH